MDAIYHNNIIALLSILQKLKLRTPDAGFILDMESKLEQLLTDKTIYSGSTLELCYIESFLAS